MRGPEGGSRGSEAKVSPGKTKTQERHPSSETREKKQREAMCSSLSRSAKKVATLGAFLASTNGIAGCGVNLRGQEAASETAAMKALRGSEKGFPSETEMTVVLDQTTGDAAAALAHQQMSRAHRAVNESEHRSISYKNFERIGTPEAHVRAYVDALPAPWRSTAAIGEVVVAPQHEVSHYKGLEHDEDYAFFTRSTDGGPGKIVVSSFDVKTNKSRAIDRLFFQGALIHEFAHANDWEWSPTLTADEALELHYLVEQAVRDPGRPKFAYPESIIVQKGDKAELRNRTKEYFAELMRMALTETDPQVTTWSAWEREFRENLRGDYEAEPQSAYVNAELVKWYFQKIDPSYRPWEGAKRINSAERALSGDAYRDILDTGKAEQVLTDEIITTVNEARNSPKGSFTDRDLAWQKKTLDMLHMQEEREMIGKTASEAKAIYDWDSMLEGLMNARANSWNGYSDTLWALGDLQWSIKKIDVLFRGYSQEQKAAFHRKMLEHADILLSKAPTKHP